MKRTILTLGLAYTVAVSAADAAKTPAKTAPNAAPAATKTDSTAATPKPGAPAAAVTGAAAASPAGTNAVTNSNFKTTEERISYALGINIGQNFKTRGVQVKPDVFFKAFNTALAGEKPLLTDAEMQSTFQELNNLMRVQAEERGKKNKTEGEAFLAENAKKQGIQKTESGLQYKVITEGTGALPKSTDRVTVKYAGKLLDGTVFDATEKHPDKKPSTFPVTGVIPGWTEALQKMKVGSHYELYIPSALAYGERGSQTIPPNSTLIFDVELLGIEPAPPTPAANEPVTSDIIKVPSKEELDKGAKIEVIKPEEVKRLQEEARKKQGGTNVSTSTVKPSTNAVKSAPTPPTTPKK